MIQETKPKKAAILTQNNDKDVNFENYVSKIVAECNGAGS